MFFFHLIPRNYYKRGGVIWMMDGAMGVGGGVGFKGGGYR